MRSPLTSYRLAFFEYLRQAREVESYRDNVRVLPRGRSWKPHRPTPRPNPPRLRLGYGDTWLA